ncbi:imidazolonepropionase [uncultured Pelagimonas sp.]|uniref:imidazolonepropionase n=1 Tax=uncultured Pelagimonas sp. TaxID=1618102 RepID=UPI00260F2683|nr:imidazolonepropionase [uncultured Pelagimonas sp.]
MLLTNCHVASLHGDTPYGAIQTGAIWMRDAKIAWVGAKGDIPTAAREDASVDLEGRLVTPGLIDCHTHLVFGGDRADEFEKRLNGVSYEEIARAGGGILSTLTATRQASEDALLQGALTRLDALIGEGVTTVEVKSGYGLEADTELRMLRVARRLAEHRDIDVQTTYLAAHAVPPEYAGQAVAYLDEIVIPTMRLAAQDGLVDAVDGFCEGIAFSTAQIARVFDAAKALNLPVKLHAEQLSHKGGTALAAQQGALSVDHLEYATAADAKAMSQAGSVAVLLPGAFYTLRETQMPPVQAFRDHGVPMALATDCNPGSSPLTSLLLAMNMGCTLFRMTPEEALAGVTRHAARALGLSDRGVIAPGQRADLAVWDVQKPAELAYRIGFNPLYKRIKGGVV